MGHNIVIELIKLLVFISVISQKLQKVVVGEKEVIQTRFCPRHLPSKASHQYQTQPRDSTSWDSNTMSCKFYQSLHIIPIIVYYNY